MRKVFEWALFAAFCGMVGWTLCATYGPAAPAEHHYHETTKVDTVGHPTPVYLPVPSPERLRIDTVYVDGGHATTTYQRVTDTVYAGCDTASRYVTDYSDSLVHIAVSSDICGKLLASQITYRCYQRTTTRYETATGAAPSTCHRLYALGTSTLGVGLAYTTQKWIAAYTYQLGNPASSYRAHEITFGLNLLKTSRKHGNH